MSGKLLHLSPPRAPRSFPLVLGTQHEVYRRRTPTGMNALEVIATVCGAAAAILAQVLLFITGTPPF